MAKYIGTLKDEKGNEFYPRSAEKANKEPHLYKTSITVTGDANTYYPVVVKFKGRDWQDYSYKKITVSRQYAETAPDSWYTSTHKGGLTFSFFWTGDSSWGGNDHDIKVLELHQNYSTMVHSWSVSQRGEIIIWLRGGTAVYSFLSETYALDVTPKYESYVDSDGSKTFSPTTTTPGLYPGVGGYYVTYNEIYPVGAIYLSTVSTNPGTIMPGTTWERIQDRFLLAAGSTYSAGSTGGSATHTHTTGNFTLGTNHIPSHNHYLSRSTNSNGSYGGWRAICSSDSNNADYSGTTTWTSSVGGGQAHNHGATGSSSNLPPYLAVYMWKRTA